MITTNKGGRNYMTNCRKHYSYVLALVMLLGMFYPKTLKAHATQETHKTDVVIHKIKLDNLAGWPKTKNADEYIWCF